MLKVTTCFSFLQFYNITWGVMNLDGQAVGVGIEGKRLCTAWAIFQTFAFAFYQLEDNSQIQ